MSTHCVAKFHTPIPGAEDRATIVSSRSAMVVSGERGLTPPARQDCDRRLLLRGGRIEDRGRPEAEGEVAAGSAVTVAAAARDDVLAVRAEGQPRYHLLVPRVRVQPL